MPSSARKSAKPTRARRARGSINPVDIMAGAFDFYRDTPVEQWSIPQLATHLNVGVTSIYWYFKSKRELVDAMTAEALTSFYESMPPLRGAGWEDLLRDFFVDFYTLLSADELKCDLIVRQMGASVPGALTRPWARADELFAALVDDGMPQSVVQHAFFTLSIYTQGFLLVERTGRAAEPISSVSGPSQEFEFGITNIIRGLRPLVADTDRANAVA